MASRRMPEGRYLELDGRGTTFIREWHGPDGAPTVLLLHGLTATSKINWYTSFGLLSRHYSILALDHRGHGHGLRSRTPFSLEACAEDTAAVLATLGIGKVIVVGYSMGGPIGQLLWRGHPDHVAGMVLCSTAAHFPHAMATNFLFPFVPWPIIPRGAPAWVNGALDRIGMDAMAQMLRNDPIAIAQAVKALGRFDSRAWLGKIDVPASVLITSHDRLVPPRLQWDLVRHLPACEVTELDGDHLVFVRKAAQFRRAVLSACRSVERRSLAQDKTSLMGA